MSLLVHGAEEANAYVMVMVLVLFGFCQIIIRLISCFSDLIGMVKMQARNGNALPRQRLTSSATTWGR
jgi:hypothetical protein